jgi:Tol biopolymer transport system component
MRYQNRWNRFGCAGVLLGLIAIGGCQTGGSSDQAGEMRLPEYPGIDLGERAVRIIPGTPPLDSPVLSPDGRRLAVQVEVYEDDTLPYEIYSLGVAERQANGEWSDLKILREGIYKKYLGRMSQPIQPCFDETGDYIVLTQLYFDSFLSIPFAGTLRSWVEQIPYEGGEPERLVSYSDFDMRPDELIQHPRISPDGRWLTFYTRVHKADQGVYLLNLETHRKVRLGDTHDKHPTFSPDGTRVYFHTVVGGKRHRFDFFTSSMEKSVVGYFDLKFAGAELVSWERVLMDEITEDYIYHKHPAEVPGTGLLFFHGRSEPKSEGGKNTIMVRRAVPGSQVYDIRLEYNGRKLKASKHPCSSRTTRDMVFIAKPKGTKTYHLLMNLTPESMRIIEDTVVQREESARGSDS